MFLLCLLNAGDCCHGENEISFQVLVLIDGTTNERAAVHKAIAVHKASVTKWEEMIYKKKSRY